MASAAWSALLMLLVLAAVAAPAAAQTTLNTFNVNNTAVNANNVANTNTWTSAKGLTNQWPLTPSAATAGCSGKADANWCLYTNAFTAPGVSQFSGPNVVADWNLAVLAMIRPGHRGVGNGWPSLPPTFTPNGVPSQMASRYLSTINLAIFETLKLLNASTQSQARPRIFFFGKDRSPERFLPARAHRELPAAAFLTPPPPPAPRETCHSR